MKKIMLSVFLTLITSVVSAQVQNYNVGDVVDDFFHNINFFLN